MTKPKILLLISVVAIVALAVNLSRQETYALVDLVGTNTDAESQAFIAFATATAKQAGGRLVVANKVIAPMVSPDQRSAAADAATRLLVITQYPTVEASELALAERQKRNPNQALRTYAAQPVSVIQSLFGKTLPMTLGLWSEEAVPSSQETSKVRALINEADILHGATDQGIYNPAWNEIISQRGDHPVWMLNFLEFNDQADYGADPHQVAPAEPITGEAAYTLYGQGMIGTLAAVDGRVGWSGTATPALANADDGEWHQIVIAVYPSITAMMTMLAHPQYKAAHVHRPAGLARTRLMATFPIESSNN